MKGRRYIMLVPRRNSFDLFDDFFDDNLFSRRERNLMKTDIREKKDKYIIDIDLPGFSKENINLSLDNGYLNVKAEAEKESQKDEDEKFVHRERFYSTCSRSFYVGENIEEKDIDAEFKNGILKISVPKKEEYKKLPESKHIQIK